MTREDLIALIAEAYETYRAMPDPDRAYRRAQWTSWPVFVREVIEAYGYGEATVKLAAPTPAAIDRADKLLEAMAACLKNHVIGAKLIWFTFGRGLTLSECANFLRRTRGWDRRRSWQRREVALRVLLTYCQSNGSDAKAA